MSKYFTYVDMTRPVTDKIAGANDVHRFGDESATDVTAVGTGELKLASVSDLETVDGLVAGLRGQV